ncbi:MAG TPA: SDR family NAD(P)-dependent oxidoreductase [Jatrophihabitans sp.]|nr:SDR family NAD(P)-dependent oxidoreductase [Jatrophihabitans sp.]
MAAACVAGALSLSDGARVVALRSKALLALAGRGGMVSVPLPAVEVEFLTTGYADLSIAALNGPSSTVVSGEVAALDELLAQCESDGIRAKRIAVDYASHSAHVDELRTELLSVLSGISPQSSDVPFYSTVTGERIDTAELTAEYWVRNLREPVRFAPVIEQLAAHGHGVLVEASPHPVLTVAIGESLDQTTGFVTGTLRRDEGGAHRLLLSLAEAWTHGATVDWTAITGPGRTVDLPTYPFQRERFLLEVPTEQAAPRDPAEEAFWSAVEREDATALPAGPAESWQAVLPELSAWWRDRHERTVLDSWRYRIVWRRQDETGEPTRLTGRWLLVVPAHSALTETCARALSRHGAEVVTIAVDTAATGRDELAAALRSAGSDGPTTGLLSLLALDGAPHPDHPATPAGLPATVALIQAAGDAELGAPVWCVTRGGVAVDDRERLAEPMQALFWGLGQVASMEHPRLWGGLVDLPATDRDADADTDADAFDHLATVLGAGSGEDQTAVRGDGVYVRRIVRAPLAGRPPVRGWRPAGTVLITGGTGGLGAQTARWLARQGAPRLLLASRRGPQAPGAGELQAELAALGAQVEVVACDVADRAALAALIDGIPAEHPLTAVVHTAAVLDDATLDRLAPEQIERVLRVKVGGALHLHELTREHDLSAFVLFSSFAATFGAPGLANYAPGNAMLEALAEQRQRDGLPATAVAWGTWAGAGMAEGGIGERARRHGLYEMDPDLATAALGAVLDHQEARSVVIDVRWERFAAVFASERTGRLLDELPEARAAIAEAAQSAADSAAPAPDELRRRLAGQPEVERDRILLELVRGHVAAVLGHTGERAVAPTRPFSELGFDSLTSVELRNRLTTATGLRLPATLVFDQPTPNALAHYLRGELLVDEAAGLPVLDELDRLDAALAEVGDDQAVRARITHRLNALAARWHASGAAPESTGDDLDAASDAELFDLLDNELESP